MNSLDLFAQTKLARLEAESLRRELKPTERLPSALVRRGDRELVSFSCNDYLGLSQDPRVRAAAIEAIERYGAGAGASRLVTGDHPLLRALEDELARHKGQPACLVFGSGYLANIGAPPALVGKGDLVVLDELSHACMYAGARMSGAAVETFRHNDVADLRRKLGDRRTAYARTLVMTETVFSMDGDRAPVADILDLAGQYDAWFLTDDAHGLGVVAPTAHAPLEMGTLSKSLGSYGGYLCASQPVVDLLKGRARTLIYTTGLPPASAAAALAALRIAQSDPDLRARPLQLAQRLTRALNLPEAQSSIVPLIVGSADKALELSEQLERRGFLVVAIRPPTVAPGSSRLRIAVSAAHSERQVDALAGALSELLAELRDESPVGASRPR